MPRKKTSAKRTPEKRTECQNPDSSGVASTSQTAPMPLAPDGSLEDYQSASSQAAADCMNVIMEFCKGGRDQAKESLVKLAVRYPKSALPHRYLARLLYHEASTLDNGSPEVVVSEIRLELLQQALRAAERATELCSNSLSSAALRATLVINELVENSALISAKGKAGSQMAGDLDCEKIQKQFKEAIDACTRALSADPPLMSEPAIYISTGSQWTFDPCSLRVQDRILPMVHEGRWEEVVAEKRRVLNCMQQVLESCHTLLDSTQIPVDGIVRLLQHILRPHQQELQLWAGQLLPAGKAQVLEELQRKFETQAAVAELLNALQPSGGELSKQETCSRNLQDPQPHDASLSVERDWDWGQEVSSAQCLRRRQKQRSKSVCHLRPRQERTLRERYLDVNGFWRKAAQEKRRHLMRVPLLTLLQEVHQDQSIEAAEDMAESIVALKEQGNHRSCYWTCPVCKQKFHVSKDYMNHVELFHEELAVVDNSYVHCTKCKKEIVGMYFSSLEMDNYTLCISCHHQEISLNKTRPEVDPFEKVFPQSPSGARGWSDTSDVLSTQGSGSYYEEYVPSPGGSAAEVGDAAPQNNGVELPVMPEESQSSTLKAGEYINQMWRVMVPTGGPETEAALQQLLSMTVRPSDAEEGTRKVKPEPDAANPVVEDELSQCDALAAHSGGKNEDQQEQEHQSSVGEFEVSKKDADWTIRGQLIDNIVNRIQAMCKANKEAGELLLGSVTQFIHKRIGQMMDNGGLEESSKMEAHRALGNLLENPSKLVFQQVASLRGLLTCLSNRDMQNVLTYLVRQRSDTLSEDGPDLSDICSSGSSGFLEAEDSGGDDDDGDEEEEILGCLSLFHVSTAIDEGMVDCALQLLWEHEERQDQQNQVETESSHYARTTSNELTSNVGADACINDQNREAFLEVQGWWLEHLNQKERLEVGTSDESYVLRWVFGNIVNAAMEHLIERQHDLRDGKDRDTSILSLYEQIACQWRTLQSYTDKRNRLDELRKQAKLQFDLAQRLQEDPRKCSKEQACQFLEAVLQSCGSNLGEGQPVLHISKAVIETLRRNVQLTQEASNRYARALLERELAVLQLVEAMLRHVSEESKREGERADDQLKRLKQELRDAESELQRVEAEGPANHRRRDILDKATKEAEHRERLQGLKQKIMLGKERIAAEEAACLRWQNKLEEACRDLTTVEEWLKQHTTRNRNLDEICSQLDIPGMVFDNGDVSEGERGSCSSSHRAPRTVEKIEHSLYRVLWVSEAIKMFDDRYVPQTGGKPYQLFSKAASWAKQLAAQYEDQIRICFDELEKSRQKLQTIACVDQAYDICAYTLKVIQKQIEEAASVAREEASKQLLQELEQEAAAKRAGDQIAKSKRENKRLTKKQKAEQMQREKAQREKERQEKLARESEDARRWAEEEQRREKERVRQEREAAIEAELEKRRKELEIMEMQRGQDLAQHQSSGNEGASEQTASTSDQGVEPQSCSDFQPAVAAKLKGYSKKVVNQAEPCGTEQKGNAKRQEKRKAAQVSAALSRTGVSEIGRREGSQDSRDPLRDLKFSFPKNCGKKGRRNNARDRNGQKSVEDKPIVGQVSIEPVKAQVTGGSRHSHRRGRAVQQQIANLNSSSSLQSSEAHHGCLESPTQRSGASAARVKAAYVQSGSSQASLSATSRQSNGSSVGSSTGQLGTHLQLKTRSKTAMQATQFTSTATNGDPRLKPENPKDRGPVNAHFQGNEPDRVKEPNCVAAQSGGAARGPTTSITSSVAVVLQSTPDMAAKPMCDVHRKGGVEGPELVAPMPKKVAGRPDLPKSDGGFGRSFSDSQVLKNWTGVSAPLQNEETASRAEIPPSHIPDGPIHAGSLETNSSGHGADSVRWFTGGYHNLADDPVWQEVLAQARERRSPNVVEQVSKVPGTITQSSEETSTTVPGPPETSGTTQQATGLSLNVKLNLNVNMSQPSQSQPQIPPVASSVSVCIEGQPIIVGKGKDLTETPLSGLNAPRNSGVFNQERTMDLQSRPLQHSSLVEYNTQMVHHRGLPDIASHLGIADQQASVNSSKTQHLRQGFGMHGIWGGMGMDSCLDSGQTLAGMLTDRSTSRRRMHGLGVRGRSLDMDVGNSQHHVFRPSSYQLDPALHQGFGLPDPRMKQSMGIVNQGPNWAVSTAPGIQPVPWTLPQADAMVQKSARNAAHAIGQLPARADGSMASTAVAASSDLGPEGWRYPQPPGQDLVRFDPRWMADYGVMSGQSFRAVNQQQNVEQRGGSEQQNTVDYWNPNL